MADQNKESEHKFYNEILSPSELFSARSRGHKLPVRGQKEFLPDGSEGQRLRLQQSLQEHWGLLAEERVERLGSLVKATWIPSEQIVELQSPAGKFWQTMGFSAGGKQLLLPEEALYLMECGNLQVFHEELPLSIQDGYESFLSTDGIGLQQYQVFGHLKRLGYVVHRFDPRSEPSAYQRQLNLPRPPAGRKRKHSASPPTASSPPGPEDGGEPEEEGGLAPSSTTETPSDAIGRSWWLAGAAPPSPPSPAPPPSGGGPDPGAVWFPDLGGGGRRPGLMAAPDPALLPAGVPVATAAFCDLAPWRHRINQRKVERSEREEQREKRRRRHHRDLNRDQEVLRCRNWVEFQQLLERRGAPGGVRPNHLWRRELRPLHDPSEPTCTEKLLEKIDVVKSSHLLDGADRLKGSAEWRIHFDVYQPESAADFRKSNPGKPYARMCVCSFGGGVPDLKALKLLARQSGGVSVVFAVVDHGDISFYTFKDFQLPTDLFPSGSFH
ncbi:tRNA-splicing endonuclease subunit Sen54 isoform 2-T2 [Menidia menidia]